MGCNNFIFFHLHYTMSDLSIKSNTGSNENCLINKFPNLNCLSCWVIQFYPGFKAHTYMVFLQNAIILQSRKKLTGHISSPLKWQQDFILRKYMLVARLLLIEHFASKFEHTLLISKIFSSKKNYITDKILHDKFKESMTISKRWIV